VVRKAPILSFCCAARARAACVSSTTETFFSRIAWRAEKRVSNGSIRDFENLSGDLASYSCGHARPDTHIASTILLPLFTLRNLPHRQ
jgi:hypothetical protein